MQHPGNEPARSLADSSEARLLSDYRAVRAATEALVVGLAAEDCVVQTMPDVSPTKWHLAHTAWFFEQFVLGPHQPGGYLPVHPRFADLFNSYYNSVGAQFHRPSRGLLTRPTLAEVLDYRREIDTRMADLIGAAGPGLMAELTPLVTLGMQHEQQHQELILTDIKHVLAANPLLPSYRDGQSQPGSAPALEWVAFPESLHVVGAPAWRPQVPTSFVFDNECPRHRVFLEAFELATRPVTNGEYLAFVRAGGYQQPEHWLSMGWDTVVREGWSAPLYWYQEDGSGSPWCQFTLHGARELDLDETICHLSYFEAEAYARWAGARLPTEFEWEVAAARQPLAGHFAGKQGETAEWLHPFCASRDANTPLRQLFGDVWEWTSSSYGPYPGYEPAVGALGEYNGKFMCNQYVLRGGSCATPQGHARPSYRNFFPPDARWQFSGLRLARHRT